MTLIRPVIFFISVFVMLLFGFGCQTTNSASESKIECPSSFSSECRPFRNGIIKMSRPLDKVKELAPIDESGWAFQSGFMIGQVHKNWIGSFSTPQFKNIWWHKVTSDLTTRPKIYGSWVFIALRDGKLQKLDFTTGKVIWETQLDKFVNIPLKTTANSVIAVTADLNVYSLDLKTGQKNWVYEVKTTETLLSQSLPAPEIHGEKIYFGTSDGQLITLSLKQGKSLWKYNPEYSSEKFRSAVGSIFFSGENVLFSRNDGLVAAIPYTSTPQDNSWLQKLPSITTSNFRDSVYYVGCINGEIYAMDPNKGTVLWRYATGQPISSIFIGETFVITSGSNGRITSLTLNGNLKWHDDVDGSLNQEPFPIGDTLYFPSGNKVLYGYKVFQK